MVNPKQTKTYTKKVASTNSHARTVIDNTLARPVDLSTYATKNMHESTNSEPTNPTLPNTFWIKNTHYNPFTLACQYYIPQLKNPLSIP